MIDGKGNEHPDYKSGDLVVVVSIEPDNIYKRINDNLVIVKKIQLIDALKGFSFNLDHINDHKITINVPENKIIN